MARPNIPAMPRATALVFGIIRWCMAMAVVVLLNVTTADLLRWYTCMRLQQLPSPCPLLLPSRLRPPGTRPRAYPPPTDEPSLAVSPKKPPRSLFLAAYSSRLVEVYISTYECRASFGMPTRGMVEVLADGHLRMTPF